MGIVGRMAGKTDGMEVVEWSKCLSQEKAVKSYYQSLPQPAAGTRI